MSDADQKTYDNPSNTPPPEELPYADMEPEEFPDDPDVAARPNRARLANWRPDPRTTA